MPAGKAGGMELFVGLDVGTSAVKGILVSSTGQIVATARRPTVLLHPAPGETELEPEEHYRSTCAVIRELASKAPSGARVRALAMAAASGNILLADREGKPLTSILSWLDNRSVGRTAELLPGFRPEHHLQITGWPYSELFPLAQLGWMRRHRPDAWRAASHVGMNTDWLLYRLTGRWGMDPSTASTFYLQNQLTGKWHRPYLDLLSIEERQLSALAPSGSVLGPLTGQAAQDTGLGTDTLVCLGCFDHPGAARGTGVLRPGDLLLSCGTSWVGFYPVADRALAVRLGLLVDPFLAPASAWGTMFALTAVGLTIEKHLDRFVAPGAQGAARYEGFNALAASAPPGAGGLSINIYGDRSRFLDDADPTLAAYTPAQVARALMEGVAFEMRKKVEELAASGIAARRLVMVGGPAESPIWPRIVSEVAGLELDLLNGQVAGAMGAAILASLGASVYRDEAEAFAAMGGRADRIVPRTEAVRTYEGLYRGYLVKTSTVRA